MGVVTFDYGTWSARYPELVPNVSPAQAQAYFQEATLYLSNAENSPVQDLDRRALLLGMLTAHIAALNSGVNGQAASPLVGRITGATQGSVSVSVDSLGGGGMAAWYQQTKYGAALWALMAPFRTFRYVPAMPRGYGGAAAVAVISGGQKLEAHLRQVAKKVGKGATVKVGFLEGATYPDGTSVPLVAATQEFGSPEQGIPPRPFFRRMIAAKSASWGPATGKLLVQTDYDAERTLGLVGQGIKGQLQQSIRDLTDPPLAPATVAAKGFDKPLVDTGHMLNSVDYEVKT